MITIRRIYAYLLAFAGLNMLAFAAANLIQLLVDVVLQSSTVAAGGSLRDSVSFSAAAALVGLPVWLVHWLWIGSWLRADSQERASTLRRLYLYAVLACAALEMVGSTRQALLSGFASALSPGSPDASLDALIRPLPFALVALGVWLGHWRLAAVDRALVGERGGSATLRRWYLYGAAFIGLVLLLSGTQAVLESVWGLIAQATGSLAIGIPRPAADALIGLSLWFVHSVVLPARVSEADTHAEDGTSVLRSVYLFGALAVGVIGCLLGLSQVLYYAVARGLGVEHPGGVGGDLLQAASGPASIAIVYGAAWAYQRQALRHQTAAFAEPPRQAGVGRLYAYLVALVALGVMAGGVAGLLWTLGDVFFPVSAVASAGGAWREQVALYATLSLVGLPVWLLHWRPHATAAGEARSLVRRLYLFLSLIVAMLALVGGAASAVYQLLGLALGASFSVAIAADLAHAVAVAGVAAVVAAYQWQVIRVDARRSQLAGAPLASSQVRASQGALASVVVELLAADPAALDMAMSKLRATGVQVTVIPKDTSPRLEQNTLQP